MQAFRVDDMTCGHCVRTITQAIQAIDPDATVTIDLAKHLVMVKPAAADARQLGGAIAEAGYTPVPVQAAPVAAAPAPQRSCCGCRG